MHGALDLPIFNTTKRPNNPKKGDHLHITKAVCEKVTDKEQNEVFRNQLLPLEQIKLEDLLSLQNYKKAKWVKRQCWDSFNAGGVEQRWAGPGV